MDCFHWRFTFFITLQGASCFLDHTNGLTFHLYYWYDCNRLIGTFRIVRTRVGCKNLVTRIVMNIAISSPKKTCVHFMWKYVHMISHKISRSDFNNLLGSISAVEFDWWRNQKLNLIQKKQSGLENWEKIAQIRAH